MLYMSAVYTTGLIQGAWGTWCTLRNLSAGILSYSDIFFNFVLEKVLEYYWEQKDKWLYETYEINVLNYEAIGWRAGRISVHQDFLRLITAPIKHDCLRVIKSDLPLSVQTLLPYGAWYLKGDLVRLSTRKLTETYKERKCHKLVVWSFPNVFFQLTTKQRQHS